MDDQKIIELYFNRQEQAITESDLKYGAYCFTIANNVLHSHEDGEECVNDTWLRAWGIIPPQRPSVLSAFFAKITRNLALDRYRASHAEKRGGGNTELVLEELDGCIPSALRTESRLEEQELIKLIELFLSRLHKTDRVLFLRRYWYLDSVQDAAKFCAMNENTAKSKLMRMRNALKALLQEEGIAV